MTKTYDFVDVRAHERHTELAVVKWSIPRVAGRRCYQTIREWLEGGVSNVGTSSWLTTSRMRRVQGSWCWTFASYMNVGEVVLDLLLMETYITLTLMMYIGHLMSLSLTRLENIELTVITIPLTQSVLCLLFLVRLGGHIVNL